MPMACANPKTLC